jgi:hypothetical protein
LPAGVNIDAGGVISGAPTASGTFNTIVVTVTDNAAGTDNANFSMTVAAAVDITTTTLPNGTVGIAYTGGDITAVNGTPSYVWGVASGLGTLPPGLTPPTSPTTTPTTSIAGTPTQAGVFNFTIEVLENSGSIDTQSFSITIDPSISISTTTLPTGVVGSSYSQNIDAAGGTAPYTWAITVGTLPPGLTLGTSTTNQVTISGTPTQDGDFTFTLEVQDDLAQIATQQLTITVTKAGSPTPGTGSSGGSTCSAPAGGGLVWILAAPMAAAVLSRRRRNA